MIRTLAIAGVSLLAISAHAQGLRSTSLGEIDPWGVGALSTRELEALPQGLWDNSSATQLETLFVTTDVHALSPAMRDLVRRALLSPARRPDVENAASLLGLRLSLVRELGDLDAYNHFVRQISGQPGVPSQVELEIDMDLARGNLASACSRVRASTEVTGYLLNARAVCFALSGELGSAELALEFARNEGAEDPWLIAAVGAVDENFKGRKPTADFSTGLKLALSIAGNLPIAKEDGYASLTPMVAAELIKRSDISRGFRIVAADIAARADVISYDTYRNAYFSDMPAMPEPPPPPLEGEPAPEPEEIERPEPINPLDAALMATRDRTMNERARAEAFAAALTATEPDLKAYLATAGALMPELQNIRNQNLIVEYGEVFALAAIATGDTDLSQRFTSGTVFEGGPQPDEYALAWIDGVRILAGIDESAESVRVVSSRLARNASDDTRAKAARMLYMFSVMGSSIAPDAREFLASTNAKVLNTGERIDLQTQLLTETALTSDALGEGVFRVAAAAGEDPTQLNMFDLGLLVRTLRAEGFEGSARALAIEGVGFQRPKS
ncbi:hypothetical protein [Ponticaulis profundi]|uniref:Uncharacterized protein n=1 Tax=Ponticaulis profundi TaxID=2665222 RepID=A0ABW1SA27_9PROT